MITFKQYLTEKAMHRGAYAEVLKRLGADAKIGFEIEVLIPEDSMYWAAPGSRAPDNTASIRTFDTLSEFDEYFHLSNADKRAIDHDYGSWLAELEDEFVDENWQSYDDDETAGRKAAKRDFDHKAHDWTEWFHAKFKNPAAFVHDYSLEPKYGWHSEDEQVYTSEPESEDYDAGWRATAGAIATSLKYVVQEPIRVRAKEPGYFWNLYQDTSIKEGGVTGLSIDDGMKGYGVEIVSPPLKASTAFDKLRKVLHWCQKSEVVTNDSTGLHVNVSLIDMTNFDPVKLVLFMGDQHILTKFGRATNTFARSQLQVIIDSIQTTGKLPSDSKEIQALAMEALLATDKQFSVNLKHMRTSNPYVEFRALGGEDYHLRLDDIEEAVGRWLSAIEAACDPQMDRQLYLKKLIGLLSKTSVAKEKAEAQRSPFMELVQKIGGKYAMDMIAAAIEPVDKKLAASSVFMLMGQDETRERIGRPGFEQLKGARDFLKSMDATPQELLNYAVDNRRHNLLDAGLRLFKLLK